MPTSNYLHSLHRQYRQTLGELRRAATDFRPGADERFNRLRAEAKRLYTGICNQEQEEYPWLASTEK